MPAKKQAKKAAKKKPAVTFDDVLDQMPSNVEPVPVDTRESLPIYHQLGEEPEVDPSELIDEPVMIPPALRQEAPVSEGDPSVGSSPTASEKTPPDGPEGQPEAIQNVRFQSPDKTLLEAAAHITNLREMVRTIYGKAKQPKYRCSFDQTQVNIWTRQAEEAERFVATIKSHLNEEAQAEGHQPAV
jgi:hypothetical protein